MSTLAILALLLILTMIACLFALLAGFVSDLIRHGTSDRYPTEWEDEDGDT